MLLTLKQQQALRTLPPGHALPLSPRCTCCTRINRAVGLNLLAMGLLEWGESNGCVRLTDKGRAERMELVAPAPSTERAGE